MSLSPPPDVAEAVAAIHAAPPRLVLAFAGAGSAALHWLHAVAGSSRTVLEAVDCYAPRSLAELVGGLGEPAVSAPTALALADWALERAAALEEGDSPLLGVGCTAAIATDRARRGQNRAVVAVHSSAGELRLYELTLEKGARERLDEEELVARLILRAVAAACGLAGPALTLGPADTLQGGEGEG